MLLLFFGVTLLFMKWYTKQILGETQAIWGFHQESWLSCNRMYFLVLGFNRIAKKFPSVREKKK